METMKKIIALILAVFGFFVFGQKALAAIPDAPDENTWVTNGPIYATAVGGDGTVYLGGSFTYVGPYTGGGVVLSKETGQVQTSFPKVDGEIYAVAADGEGGWYVGGYFTKVGGIARNNLAHILADGTVDSSWNPNPNSYVSALAVSGSTVYVGGHFTSIGGQERNYIAALDATTGQATSWNPNANNRVSALAVSGSTVYAGGWFTSIGGQGRNRIAALDATTGQATSWNPNANNVVYTLAVSGSTVYAGGDFTSIGGANRPYFAAFRGETTPPSVSLTPLSPDPTNDKTPSFSGTATDSGGEVVSSVEYQIDSTSGSWTACNADDGAFDEGEEAFTCEHVDELSDGEHTIYVRATDSNGNTTSSANYATDSFTVDTVPPTNNSLTINGGSEYTTNRTVTLALSSTGASQMMVSESASFSGASWETYSTSKSFTLSSSDGTKTVYAKFKDAAGNESTAVSDSIVLDQTAPASFSLISPDDSAYTSSSRPSFSFKATSDATSGLSFYEVIVDSASLITNILPTCTAPNSSSSCSDSTHGRFEDDSKIIIYDGENITASWKEESKDLNEGTHHWKVVAVDKAGNRREEGERTLYVDKTAPAIRITKIGDYDNLTLEENTITSSTRFYFTQKKAEVLGIADAGSKIEGKIKKASGGEETTYCSTTVRADSSFTCSPNQEYSGEYLLTFSAKDSAGNQKTLPSFKVYFGQKQGETEIVSIEKEGEKEEEVEGKEEKETVCLKVRVIDEKEKPAVAGAQLTLFSNPKTAVTDKDGWAVFENKESFPWFIFLVLFLIFLSGFLFFVFKKLKSKREK